MSVLRIIEQNVESQEAVVEITIPICVEGKSNCEDFVVKTFCHPFHYLADDYSVSLYGFGVDNIWIENSIQKPKKTENGFFSYRLSAQVVDASKKCVKLGEYDFFLDVPFPKDVNNEVFVSFDVQRIDMCITMKSNEN